MNFKTLLVLLLTITSIGTLHAQQRGRQTKNSEFKNNLWFGGSAGLGFQSFNGQSTFLLALFPMAGYKLTENLSIGPRIGAAYQHIRTLGGRGEVFRFNPIEFSGGIFTRYKAFYNFFAHAEYEVANEKTPVVNVNGIPVIQTFTENNFYLGAGYTSGGRIASEIYILYNVLEQANTLQPPWSIRGGLTYNF